jgi:hypothetical protein
MFEFDSANHSVFMARGRGPWTNATSRPLRSTNQSAIVARDDVLIEVVDVLLQRLGGRVRDVRLIQMADELVLQGGTSPYYTKQMAETIVRELAEQVVLVDEIVVL